MLQLTDLIADWSDAAAWLQSGRSLILTAPRDYGTHRFPEEMKKILGNTAWVRLRVDDYVAASKLDYCKVWEATKRQAGYRRNSKVDNRDSYGLALRKLIEDSTTTILFLITISGTGSESYQFDLIALLDQVRHSLPFEKEDTLQLLILDDYSLYYYQIPRTEHSSLWKVERIEQRPLDESGIQELLCRTPIQDWFGGAIPPDAAEKVYRLTGGHVGLIVELLEHLNSRPKPIPSDFWGQPGRTLLLRSSVLSTIRRGLGEDPRGLTEVALGYAKSRIATDFTSPNIQYLRRLGVIHSVFAGRMELCPGLIKELVTDLSETTNQARPLGTLVSELGPRVYDGRSETMLAEDTDLIVLHISDMHVGPGYPFQLPQPVAGRQEAGKKSLADMMQADLESLKLLGKIDLLVVSGDFTERAGLDQFIRARDILRDLLDKIGLDTKRMVFTAGNHDVDWKPGELSQVERISGVSRETFETFRELMGLPQRNDVDIQRFVSRCGKVLLRVLSLDSNFVEGPQAAGIGYVSDDSLAEADRLLRKEDNSEFESVRTWMVLHHHVFPASTLTIDNIQRPKLTVLANAADVLAFANSIKAEVILHGHEHQPAVTVARRWPAGLGIDFQPIIVVGAGSISAPRDSLGPFSHHHYYILFRKRDRVVVRSRRMGDTGLAFAPHNDLVIPMV